MDLMERLEKTANELAPLNERYEQAAEEFDSYDQKPGLRSAVGLGSIAAGTAAGAMLGKGRGLGAIGGGALGAGVGAIGGIAGQIPINNHLNATQPGRAEAFDRLLDVSQEVDEQGWDQQASELMDRLEKTAAESSEEKPEEAVAEAEVPEDEEEDKKTKGNEVSHAEAGEEKSAAELMARLEKTAASVSGIKNTLSAASGKQYNAAKKDVKAIQSVSTPKAFEANAKGVGVDNGGVSKARKNLEKLEGDLINAKSTASAAKKTRNEARGALAPAAVGAAAVGGAAAGAAAGSAAEKKKQEKTASEEFMNGLFKEAATAILSMETPEVKAYRDPMDGIKFDR